MTTTYQKAFSTAHEISYLIHAEGYAANEARRVVIMEELKRAVGKRTCEFTGKHKWVDTSSAGPESGDMAAHCTRCGFSFHHQLY